MTKPTFTDKAVVRLNVMHLVANAKRSDRQANNYRSMGHADRLSHSAMKHILNKIRQHDDDWCREKCPTLADYVQRKIDMVSASYFLQRNGRDYFAREA